MNIRQIFLFIAIISSCDILAHIEPPKSAAERMQASATCEKYRRAEVAKSMATQTGADGKTFVLAEWIYDNKGRESQIVMHDKKGGDKTFITQTYDQHDNLILDADLSESGRIMEMNVLEYTDNQLIRRIVSYDSSLRISGILEYSYHVDTVLATKLKPDFTLQYTISYVYSNGKNTEAIQRDSDGKLMIRTVNIFGADGLRHTKEVYNNENKLDFYYTYEYTGEGDYRRIEKRSPEKALLRNDDYSYNEKGLQHQIIIKDGKGNLLLERSYSYYYLAD